MDFKERARGSADHESGVTWEDPLGTVSGLCQSVQFALLRTGVARSTASCVVFVVKTAVVGEPGNASFTRAPCVAIAATPSMPASIARALPGSAKGPRRNS